MRLAVNTLNYKQFMWQKKDNYLEKTFSFDSFGDAVAFVNKVADIANEQDHHPKIIIDYTEVTLQITTHSAGNTVTEKDHLLAQRIDTLFETEGSNNKLSTQENLNLKEVKLYTDGGSRGNPGPSAIGFVVHGMDDAVIDKQSKYIGITTNNQAEYQGLKEGLELCHTMNVPKVHIYMDSLLVINQMKGIYKVKNRDLWPIYEATKELISDFKSVSFTHVPRQLNKIADEMVNECLDNAKAR